MSGSNRTISFNPLKYPIYVLSKPVGAACNLDCHYCYYLEKGGLYKGGGSKMSDELLEHFTREYIEAQPIDAVSFTWHGGETLLRGLDFFKKGIAFQKKYAGDKQIANSIQTNGILLNDDWCRFFKDNDFLVGISIDGPEDIHNRYRVDKGGRGSFSRVMRGIELLQKHGVDFNTLSVINDYSAKFPLEIYNFFKEIGSQYMQFAPIVERWGDRDDRLTLLPPDSGYEDTEMPPWCVTPKAFGEFYCKIFEEWVRKDVGRYYVQLFDAALAGMHGVEPGVCIFAKSCGHAAAMEFNGDVYCCDHFVFPEYKLGSIKDRSLVELMLSNKQLEFGNNKYNSLPRVCKECRFVSMCNGECPKNRISTSADGEYGLNYLCEGYRMFFEYAEPYIRFMSDELKREKSPANVMEFAKNFVKPIV